MSVPNPESSRLTPPALGYGPVSSEPYRSPSYFELERAHVFRRVWLCVGREEEAAQPGDFVVKEVEICKASALIVRGADRRLRAFHNVCAHRSNKVAWESRGHVKQFVCRYHNWTYGLNGELRGMTDAANFFDIDKTACALTPIHVECWQGFIFLNFSTAPEQSLGEYLGGLEGKLAGFPFDRFSACVEMSGVFNGNWKAAVDAFQEPYHLGFLHRRSIGPQFTSPYHPSGHFISVEFFGPHRAGSVWGNLEFRPRPIEQTAFSYASPIGGTGNAAAEEVVPGTINPGRDPNWAIEMISLFPNVVLFVSRQGFMTHSFWPLSYERTRWACRMYHVPARSARQLFSQQFQTCLARDTFVEDGTNIERSQEGLNSGARGVLHFQDNEVFARHQYGVVEDFIRRGGQAPPGT